jgi:ribosomal protein S18 acetylase RimI-like enzyme
VIQSLQTEDLPDFFSYLDLQLKENGKDGALLFQPQSRSLNGFPKEKEVGFVDGLSIPIGVPKWRRAWVYRDVSGGIVGHIDLRGRIEPFTSHRALLGMGVHQLFRGQGIGASMVAHVLRWAKNSGVVDVIDLEVLAHNEPAIRLYQKAGFDFVCKLEDMFRIDGQSEPYVLMTMRLENA